MTRAVLAQKKGKCIFLYKNPSRGRRGNNIAIGRKLSRSLKFYFKSVKRLVKILKEERIRRHDVYSGEDVSLAFCVDQRWCFAAQRWAACRRHVPKEDRALFLLHRKWLRVHPRRESQ